MGRFRDVATIDVSSQPEGWTVSLLDGEDEFYLPYELTLSPGISHPM